MYFGVRWQEPRIIGPPPPEDNPYVPIDLGFIDFLWVPDIYIYHLKSIQVLNIFTQFAGKQINCDWYMKFWIWNIQFLKLFIQEVDLI